MSKSDMERDLHGLMTKRVWSLPEPVKSTSWTSRELPVDFRDAELEADIKRTEETKAQMSPPGALGLPELLEAARLEYGIPDGAFKARALFDRIHIYPLNFEGDKKKTKGGVWVPHTAQQRDLQNAHRGILISMGLSAADKCVSHGVALGHIVRTIRNAPHAQECARLSSGSLFYLVMRDGDLTGDETQEEDLRAGRTMIVDTGGEHSYCYEIDGRKKRGVFIQDSW